MLDESRKKLISGVRNLDNCYGLLLDANIVCNNIERPSFLLVTKVCCLCSRHILKHKGKNDEPIRGLFVGAIYSRYGNRRFWGAFNIEFESDSSYKYISY